MQQQILDRLAQRAYAAYGEAVLWRNYQGLPLPRVLVEQPLPLRVAWRAAVEAVLRGLLGLAQGLPPAEGQVEPRPVGADALPPPDLSPTGEVHAAVRSTPPERRPC